MIRILIVDEVPLLSEVLTAVLEGEEDFKVVGSVSKSEDVRGKLEKHLADVVLISSTLPKTEAFEVIHMVKNMDGQKRVILVGMPPSEDHILAFFECGADGYVLREDSVSILMENIRSVYGGHFNLSKEVVSSLVNRVRELSTFCKEMLVNLDALNLTDRELDVLRLLAKRKTNADIADELSIEIGTVKSHVHNILQKLNVDNRREAARYFPLIQNAAEPLGNVNS